MGHGAPESRRAARCRSRLSSSLEPLGQTIPSRRARLSGRSLSRQAQATTAILPRLSPARDIGLKLARRHWLRVEIALDEVAAECAQGIDLRLRFRAFDDALDAEVVAQSGDERMMFRLVSLCSTSAMNRLSIFSLSSGSAWIWLRLE